MLSFYLANKEFTNKNPEIVATLASALTQATDWPKAHPDEAAKLFTEATNVANEVQHKTVGRTHFFVTPVTGDIIAKQQHSG